ncbi:hypothetical protein KR084_006087, partial [Drosophila pseudotakahashii]
SCFLLVISMLGIEGASKCPSKVPSKSDPHCGYALGCVYNGKNKADVLKQSCKRKAKGKPGM